MNPKRICSVFASRDFSGLLEIIDEVSEVYRSNDVGYDYDIFTNGNMYSVKFKIYDNDR